MGKITTRCCEEAGTGGGEADKDMEIHLPSARQRRNHRKLYEAISRKKIAKTIKRYRKKKSVFLRQVVLSPIIFRIIGVAEANKRSEKRVITTSIEHPSLSATMAYIGGTRI